jgi:hypothetical protein
MSASDGEEEERKRQERERSRTSFLERLYGSEFRTTASGFTDGRSLKRTGRVIQLPLRVHPRIKAMLMAIVERDKVPSMVVLFEEMAQAYLEKHGDIDWARLPSDEDLVRRIEQERDKRDGE